LALHEHDLARPMICTGAVSLAAKTLDWGETRLGVVRNESCGMTGMNLLIGNCAAFYPRSAGSRG
jgi:hypothetical protein